MRRGIFSSAQSVSGGESSVWVLFGIGVLLGAETIEPRRKGDRFRYSLNSLEGGLPGYRTNTEIWSANLLPG